MELYLIRHGATEGNLEKRYVGSTDEPLTKDGILELKKNRIYYPVPQYVVTSPLQRCIKTAAVLFPGIAGETVEDLRECEFGEFEYRNYQELAGNEAYQAWIDSGGMLAFPGGESREEFCRRSCRAFLESLKELVRKGYGSVAYVVHGGTIMAVMERFCLEGRPYFDWQVKNGQGFHLHLEEENFVRLTGEHVLQDSNMQSVSRENSIRPTEESGNGETDTPPVSLEQGVVKGFLTLTGTLPVPEEKHVPTGIEEVFVVQKNKRLQCGYTTGSCAAAAAKAAVMMLLGGEKCRQATLTTPAGVRLNLEIECPVLTPFSASCGVRKFGGDDPDATDGLLILAEAGKLPGSSRVELHGGKGVGRVTKPGLEQAVGEPAINRVPRQMIREGVLEICRQYGYEEGISITISVPGGEETAKRTFNPRLGIEGGISILGTSGIVVPMSEQSLIESIKVEMRQKVKSGERYLLITPGNYGADFLSGQEQYEKLRPEYSMKCSNYVGETLDMAMELGVKGILFVSHIGKFVKVSGGIMNTHSAHGDCRAELMAAQAMRSGAEPETVERLLGTNTTEEAVGILKETGDLEGTIRETAKRIKYHLQKRCMELYETEVVLFSNQYGYLGETEGAAGLMIKIAEEKQRLYRKKDRRAGGETAEEELRIYGEKNR